MFKGLALLYSHRREITGMVLEVSRYIMSIETILTTIGVTLVIAILASVHRSKRRSRPPVPKPTSNPGAPTL